MITADGLRGYLLTVLPRAAWRGGRITAAVAKRAAEFVGSFSAPSKMPGHGTSTPATACKVGSRLRDVPGSTCSTCYAMRGAYPWPSVQAAMERRLALITSPQWVLHMATAILATADRDIGGEGTGLFRWHDSGDVQSVDHLASIAAVAMLTPTVDHWLPTREYSAVRAFLAVHGAFPRNLTVRLSAHMIDGPPPTIRDAAGRRVATSTVTTDAAALQATRDAYAGARWWPERHVCPASDPDAKGASCDTFRCRACWDGGVPDVAYFQH